MLTRLCLTALSWIQFSGAQLIVEQTAAGGVYLSGALDLDLASYTNCYVSLLDALRPYDFDSAIVAMLLTQYCANATVTEGDNTMAGACGKEGPSKWRVLLAASPYPNGWTWADPADLANQLLTALASTVWRTADWNSDHREITMVDVGCNLGIVSHHALKVWPEARSYCIEPVTETLREGCEGSSSKLRCRELLISSDGPGEAVVWSNGAAGDLCATMSERTTKEADISEMCGHAERPPSQRLVPVVTLDWFADVEKIDQIDVLKVTVQGAEHLVFEGMQTLLQAGRVSAFIFEWTNRWLMFNHRNFESSNLKTLVAALNRFGFDSFMLAGELVPLTASCWSDSYLAMDKLRVVVALHRDAIDIEAVRQAYFSRPQHDKTAQINAHSEGDDPSFTVLATPDM